MKIKLDCSNNYIPKLTKLLPLANIEIDDNGPLMIIDNPIHQYQTDNPFDDVKSIILIESFGNDIHIHHSQQDTVTIIQEPLYALEERFKDDGFIRVNKSQIVNIRFIREIEPIIGQKYLLTLKDNRTIDVNRTYYKTFRNYLQL